MSVTALPNRPEFRTADAPPTAVFPVSVSLHNSIRPPSTRADRDEVGTTGIDLVGDDSREPTGVVRIEATSAESGRSSRDMRRTTINEAEGRVLQPRPSPEPWIGRRRRVLRHFENFP